jgi:hypothetical protein
MTDIEKRLLEQIRDIAGVTIGVTDRLTDHVDSIRLLEVLSSWSLSDDAIPVLADLATPETLAAFLNTHMDVAS